MYLYCVVFSIRKQKNFSITLSNFKREFAPNKGQLLCRIPKENLQLIKDRKEENE